MNDHSHRWQSVAAAVAGRMREMGMLDNASLIRASGLSEPFVRGVLAGTPRGTPRRSSIVKLCTALGWTDSSIDQILACANCALWKPFDGAPDAEAGECNADPFTGGVGQANYRITPPEHACSAHHAKNAPA